MEIQENKCVYEKKKKGYFILMYDKKFPESEIWIGTGKIAFTPDDWIEKKSSSKDVIVDLSIIDFSQRRLA